jgi:hypothetical protein
MIASLILLVALLLPLPGNFDALLEQLHGTPPAERNRIVESSDGHDWPSWRERPPDILRFLFKPN